MVAKYTLFGWKISYYTAKLQCYLNYRRIPHQFKLMNAFDLMYTAKKKVGEQVMPILQTPDGKWQQDTKAIIVELEKQFPDQPFTPTNRTKRIICTLLEIWGDEFWIPPAMHYRWNYSSSVAFFKAEARHNLLPWFIPNMITNSIVDHVASVLIRYLPVVGIRPEQFHMIEEWTEDMLSSLNLHFQVHPYLMGRQVTVADFSLAGPLVAHLGRDTYPRENIILNKFPHVDAWIARISSPQPNETYYGHDDDIPSTLQPILKSIFVEMLSMMEQSIEPVTALKANPKFFSSESSNKYSSSRPLPRSLHEIEIPWVCGKYKFKKNVLPFHLWKMHFVTDELKCMNEAERREFDMFLEKNGLDGKVLKRIESSIPKLERVGLRVKFIQ
jgi:glutathione S-transferase